MTSRFDAQRNEYSNHLQIKLSDVLYLLGGSVISFKSVNKLARKSTKNFDMFFDCVPCVLLVTKFYGGDVKA